MESVFHKNDRTQRRLGFTLIELLVVISIIAVVISILLPALKKSRESAKDMMCKSNLRSIGQATMAYTVDFDDYMPMNSRSSIWFFYFLKSHSHSGSAINLGMLYPHRYISEPTVFYCPLQRAEYWTYKPDVFWKDIDASAGLTGNTPGGYGYWLRSDLDAVKEMPYGNDYVTRLSAFGRHAYAADLTYAGEDTWAHSSGSTRQANVLSTDGSVRMYIDDEQQVRALSPYTTDFKIQQVYTYFDEQLQ